MTPTRMITLALTSTAWLSGCMPAPDAETFVDEAVAVRPPPPDYSGLPKRKYGPGAGRISIEDAREDGYSRCKTLGTVTCCDYADGRLYSVFASPLQATIIRLGDDEELLDVVAGDSSGNWVIEPSNMGSYSVVYVKPTSRRLTNSITLTTTRERIYTLDVRTVTDGSHNRIFHWDYDKAGNEWPGQFALIPKPRPTTATVSSAESVHAD